MLSSSSFICSLYADSVVLPVLPIGYFCSDSAIDHQQTVYSNNRKDLPCNSRLLHVPVLANIQNHEPEQLRELLYKVPGLGEGNSAFQGGQQEHHHQL
jgi:hypothetical protein